MNKAGIVTIHRGHGTKIVSLIHERNLIECIRGNKTPTLIPTSQKVPAPRPVTKEDFDGGWPATTPKAAVLPLATSLTNELSQQA